MTKLLYLLAFLGPWSCATTRPPDPINQPELARLVGTLAADGWRGREVFTPEIAEAAAFIRQEMEAAGLVPMPGANSLLQPFSVYAMELEEAQVQLAGRTVPFSDVFAQTQHRQLSWSEQSPVTVHHINPEQDLREALVPILAGGQDALVLVHPAHQADFARYRTYLTRPGRLLLPKANAPSQVFVLTETLDPSTFRVDVRHARQERQLTNVAGMIPGQSQPEEMVLFSAHYDHIGVLRPVEDDSIANGADDNASGVAALLALARYFWQQPPPERTLVFAAFTAEEIGGFGSQYFSRQLNPDQIVAMLNIEMIGKPSKFGPNTAFLTGFERSSLGPLLQQELVGSPYALHPDPYPAQNLFYRSDNATLARLGVPAHTISSSQIDQDTLYHSVDDELETLDLEHLTSMVRAIARSVRGLVKGTVTPTRIDRTTVD